MKESKFLIVLFIVLLTSCSSQNSLSKNNEIEELLNFVEDSSDSDFLGFLGSIGDYYHDMKKQKYDEDFKKYLDLFFGDELPNMLKYDGSLFTFYFDPKGIEIINQFHIYRFKIELENLKKFILEKENINLWETKIQYFSADCRYFAIYNQSGQGRIIEIEIPGHYILMEGYVLVIHNQEIFNEIIEFEKEIGIRRIPTNILQCVNAMVAATTISKRSLNGNSHHI